MADSYIGSLICLITKSDIRYEGFLFHLDAQQSTIGLRNVKSYGTEGRKKDGPQISPSDKVYEYIFFRGSDIKDLQVISSPLPQSTSVVPDDPAIIQSNFPNPAPTTMGMSSPGASQMTNVSTIAPSMLPVAPFQVNLPSNPLPPSSSVWGSSLPPPPVNINGPAVPDNWPGLMGSSGGVSHFQLHRFPPPPQSLVASHPVQQQRQQQNVNASLAGGSSLAEQYYPLMLPMTTASPNLVIAMPSPSSGSNPGQPARPVFSLSSIPMPNNASRSFPTVATNSDIEMVSPMEGEFSGRAVLSPVTKEPSSIVSTSDSLPTILQTMPSTVDTENASLVNLPRLSVLAPEVQSGVKDSSSSQSLQRTNLDTQTVQASGTEPLPLGSTEETPKSLPKSSAKVLRGSTSSHHNRSQYARERDGAYHDTISIHHSNRDRAHRGIMRNGAAVYTHQNYRKQASGRGNGLVGAALHSRQSNIGTGREKVPNGIPQHNYRNVGSQFRGRGSKNSHLIKRFSVDFDFEAMNEKFNKKEVWDSLGKSNKAESNEGIEDEKEMDDNDGQDEAGNGNANHEFKPVYCKDDFFDSLSCHALNHEFGKVKFSELRKKDAETFGEIQRHQRGRGQGARMSGASQGSYRVRGYDNARGGRGQGRTVWGRVT